MNPWKTTSSEIVYETPWIKVRRDEVITHQEKSLTYSVVESQHPSVFVVALNDKDEVLLEYHYRYTTGETSWELPAGQCDGQDPLTAAKRELLEETGYKSDDWINLGKLYQAVGVANLPMYVCVARGAYPATETVNEDGEPIIEQNFFSPEAIDDMIQAGQILSAGEIAAYYLARIKGIDHPLTPEK